MKGTVNLTTPRLVLRKYRMEDADVLHREFGIDPEMYEYSGWNPYATPEMAAESVRRQIESYDDETFYGWAVERDGQLIGTVGAYDYDANAGSIEVGLSIRKSCWGHGYATEVLAEVLRYLTEEEGIDRVAAWCAANNIGSKRAMEKCGMQAFDVTEGSLNVDGQTHDQLFYQFVVR